MKSRLEVRKVIRLYTGFQFFFSLLLWLPIFYEYQRRIGLSDPQIFLIQSIYYTAFCLLEIPTGLFADTWGHRSSMKAGAVVLVVANLLPIVAANYGGFLGHFLLVALARSLVSGASSAYLYDYLKHHGAAGEYKPAEGRARAYGLAGKVIGWAGIGALMEWHFTLPYSLTALAAALAAVYAWRMPALAEAVTHVKGVRANWLTYLGPAARMLKTTPTLGLVMLQGISIFVLARICQVNLFQPILGEKSFGVASYGLIMSGMTVFEAVGSALPAWPRKIQKGLKISDLNLVFLLTLIVALSLAGLARSDQFGTLIGLGIFFFAVGLAFPVQRQLLNDAIPDSRYRATLLSIESIVDRAACAGVAAGVGEYVASGRITGFLIGAAGTSVVGVLILALAFWRLEKRRQAVSDSACEAVLVR